MKNLILAGIIAVIIVSASLYVYISKKHGHKCIGCPHGKTCSRDDCTNCK